MNNENIRVVIADDHPGVRAGLRSILAEAKDIEVVGQASDGAAAIDLVESRKPDILLLDVQMPVKRGDEVARTIARTDWGGKILAISSYGDRQLIRSMREAGAAGYIMKDEAPAVLVEALRKVYSGQAEWVGVAVLPESKTVPNPSALSDREILVLEALASGSDPEDPPKILDMAPQVFRAYVEFLMKKFGAGSPADLLDRVREDGILSDDTDKNQPENKKSRKRKKDHGN